MSLRETLTILEKISDIAALTGIQGQIDEDRMVFGAGFSLPDNRSQVVYVRPTSHTIKDSVVVTFFSPCLAVKSGFMKGITKEQALDLLRMNEELLFARYGLWTMDKRDLIVASVDQILDTLDPDEFEAHMWHVAMAADHYEKLHGQDEY